MCTLTHFAHPQIPSTHNPSTLCPAALPDLETHQPQRFRVVLAGNAFFHIKEISTGHVRGFRGDHNEACALARALESRI
jgi:hypothetical protein